MNNAPIPLPVVGPVGGGLPPASGNASGGADSAFADSLSLALYGALAQPIVPMGQSVIKGSGELALSLPDLIGIGTDDALATLLNESALGLAAPLLLGTELQAEGSQSGSPASGSEPPSGQRLAGIPSLTSDTAKNQVLPSLESLAQGLQPETTPIAPLPNPASPLYVTDQGQISNDMTQEASLMALAATALQSADDVAQAEQALAQLRQSLPNHAERQGTGETAAQGIVPSTEGSLAELVETFGHRDQKSVPMQPGQAGSPPIPRPTFAQAAENRADGSSYDAEPLLQARAQVANLHVVNQQQGAQIPGTARPATSVAGQSISPAEAIGIDHQASAEPLDLFGQEIGRAEPAVAAGSKSSAPPVQPPSTQLSVQIARAVPQGIERFSVQLHPADLGAVEIQLNIAEDGHMRALIIAERPETLDLLQRDSRTLERSLNDTGLQLESGGLSFSLKQEQNQGGQGFSAWSHQHATAHPGGRIERGAGESTSAPEPVRLSQQRLLDIRT